MKYLILLYVLHVHHCVCFIKKLNLNFEHKLQNSIGEIIKNEFQRNDAIVNAYLSKFKNIFPIICKQNYFFNVSERLNLTPQPIQNVILYVETLEDIEKLIEVKPNKTWNAKGKFLIFLFKQTKNLSEIFVKLWYYNIINVKLVQIQNDGKLELFTDNPYALENNCWKYSHPKSGFSSNSFPTKQIKLARKCKFKVGIPYFMLTPMVIDENKGIFISLTQLLAQALNLYIELKWIDTESYEILINSDVLDASANIFLKDIEVEHSHVYFHDRLQWTLAKPPYINNVKLLLKIFSKEVWVGILISFLAISLVFIGISHQDLKLPEISDGFFCTFRLLIGSSLPIIPKATHAKIITLFSLVYSIYLNCFMQGRYASVLTKPLREKTVTNVREMVDSDYIYPLLYPSTRDIFLKYDIPYLFKLGLKALDRDIEFDNLKFLEYAVRNPNKAALVYESSLKIYKNYEDKINFLGSDGIPNLDHTIVVKKDNHLLPKINWVISSSFEGGFFNKWFIDLQKIVFEKVEENIPLKLGHFLAAFVILFMGYFIGFFIFIFEIVVKKIK